MTTKDTVLLDVDGTLADTNYLHVLAWARAFASVDVTVPQWELHRAIGMGGDKLVPAVAGEQVESEHGETVRAAWEEEYAALLPEVRLLPGARDLVLALAGRGLKVALASSGKDRFTQRVVELLDLPEGTLATTTSSDDAEESKPAPEILEVALEKAGGTSALGGGDTPSDVTAAARLGMPCLTVRTGGFGVAELEDAEALAVYETPGDLVDGPWEEWLAADAPEGAADVESPLPGDAGEEG